MVKQKIYNESKDEKFKRIATTRANRILDNIRLLGNCSNKRIYKYSDEDVNKIFNIIDKELKRTKLLFQKKKRQRIDL
jgi:hypothetical protein